MKLKHRKRLRVFIPLAVAAAALMSASLAWACTIYNGQSWIWDTDTVPASWQGSDSVKRTAVRGGDVSITIMGDGVAPLYGEKDGDLYRAVMAPSGSCCGGSTTTTLADNVVLAMTPTAWDQPMVPDLGPNTVTIPGDKTRGDYWICYLNKTTLGNDSTAHATLSIV